MRLFGAGLLLSSPSTLYWRLKVDMVVPSAITELLHWQHKGYALLIPRIYERRKSVEEIR